MTREAKNRMKCGKCKYKRNIGNTKETDAAICTNATSFFPINCDDDCHFLPKKRELHCIDCSRLRWDTACMDVEPNNPVYESGNRCLGFSDVKEDEFTEILQFWKTQGLYDRVKINQMLEEFEKFYADIEEQSNESSL